MHETLHAATTAVDRARVEQLLSEGASARVPLAEQGSLLRVAHAGSETPEGRGVFQALRAAARREADNGVRTPGLAAAAGAVAPGAGSARAEAGADLKVVLLEGPAALAAKSLASLLAAPRREADVAARGVMDAARLLFCLQLRQSAWTIVPFAAPSSPWALGDIVELNRRGDGLAPLCRALAECAGRRVILVEEDAFTTYGAEGTIARRDGESEDGMPLSDEGRRQRLDAELAELGVWLPAMRIGTDGYDVQLEVTGVDPTAVERLDLVALQELGDPLADRRPAAPSGVPQMVGPGGRAIVAEARPAVVERVAQPSAPPAMVPVVGSEPPPMVTKEVTQNEIVSPPPKPPAPAATPPAASAPPPMVSADAVVPNSEPD